MPRTDWRPGSRVAVITLGAIVLLVGIILQAARMRDLKRGDITSPPRPIDLADKLPREVSGWSAADQPLGATEFLASEVARTLNYDDYVFRTYRAGDREFAVYVAYWSPGRMPMEKVASHTPDRCWSENGWSCTAMRYPVRLRSPDGPLRPGYWRTFQSPGGSAQQFVIYWHRVGDEFYDYGSGLNGRPNALKWWRDTLHYAVKGSGAQYFIRVTSNRSFSELEADPGFAGVLRALARLGLSAPERRTSKARGRTSAEESRSADHDSGGANAPVRPT